jgi:hypothetical protein
MQELIPINIILGDRSYRVKINPADEQDVRKTLKTINDKIIEFKTQFAGKDMQDYIAMVLLWFATLPAASDVQSNTNTILNNALQNLEDRLDKVL